MPTRLAAPLPTTSVLSELMIAVRTSEGDVYRHLGSTPSSATPMDITGRGPEGSRVVDDANPQPWTKSAGDLFADRRSLRFFDDTRIDLAALTAALRDAVQTDLDSWGDGVDHGTDVIPVVIALNVRGLTPGIYRFDPIGSCYTQLAEVDQDVVADMVLQTEYAGAAAIVAAVGSLEAATARYAAHGQRLLTVRGAGLCYSTYLQACAGGLTGSVFAGFLLSGLSRLLVIDGFHQTQVFAVALGYQAEPTDFSTP